MHDLVKRVDYDPHTDWFKPQGSSNDSDIISDHLGPSRVFATASSTKGLIDGPHDVLTMFFTAISNYPCEDHYVS